MLRSVLASTPNILRRKNVAPGPCFEGPGEVDKLDGGAGLVLITTELIPLGPTAVAV